MPARNGAWKRFGSVAVTQFQRSVCRKAEKRRGVSKPLAASSPQPSCFRIRRSISWSQKTSISHPGRRLRRRRDGRRRSGRASRPVGRPPRASDGSGRGRVGRLPGRVREALKRRWKESPGKSAKEEAADHAESSAERGRSWRPATFRGRRSEFSRAARSTLSGPEPRRRSGTCRGEASLFPSPSRRHAGPEPAEPPGNCGPGTARGA